jgi:hypothetical protein
LYAIKPQIQPSKLKIANIKYIKSKFLFKKKFEINGMPKKPVVIMEIKDNAIKNPFA